MVQATAQFADGNEAPRTEWFMRDRQAAATVTVAKADAIARITSPANGMVIAIDPDIPEAHQKLPISTEGTAAGMHLKLNGAELAAARDITLWTPRVGEYRIELEDEAGRVVDTVRFTVR